MNPPQVVKKYKRVYKFAIALLLLVSLWIIIGIISFTAETKSFSNKSLVPEEVDFVMTINSKKLIKELLVDVLFNTELDKSSAELFIPKEGEVTNRLGADITSEVVVFYDNWQGNSAQGLLFNLSNQADFDRYQSSEEHTIKNSNSKYGVIINLDEGSPEKARSHYTNLANRIINSEKKDGQAAHAQPMLNLAYRGEGDQYLNDLSLNLNIEKETIFIEGKGKLKDSAIAQSFIQNALHLPISEKYFQLQTSEIPEDAMKYLTNFLSKLGVTIPHIKSMQILVYGVTIGEINGSMAVLPNLDCVLRLDDKIQIDSLMKDLNPYYRDLVNFEKQHITLGDVVYHYTQVSENEIHIGVTEKPKYTAKELKPHYSMNGYPSTILEIEGKGFIAGFIKMMPPVKLSKQFLEEVEHFNIHAEQAGDSLVIKGEISIREEKFMTVEMAKYGLLLFN